MGFAECCRTIRDKWHFGKLWQTPDSEGKFNGASAPLWVNCAPYHFLALAFYGSLFFIGCLLSYVLYVYDQKDCSFEMKPILISQIVMVGFNATFDILYYLIKQASDEEWSLYLIFIWIQIFLDLITVFFGFFSAFATYDKFEGHKCFDMVLDSNIWKYNLSVTTNNLVYLVLKLSVLLLMTNRFYKNTRKYLAFKAINSKE